MTLSTFYSLCMERDIFAGMAIENESIREALKERNDELVIELLDSEF